MLEGFVPSTDLQYRLCESLLTAGDLEAGCSRLAALAEGALAAGPRHAAARAIHRIAQAHAELGSPMDALPYALAAASHVYALGLHLLAAEVVLTLAEVWVGLGPEFSTHALRLLDSTKPQCMGEVPLAIKVRICLLAVLEQSASTG